MKLLLCASLGATAAALALPRSPTALRTGMTSAPRSGASLRLRRSQALLAGVARLKMATQDDVSSSELAAPAPEQSKAMEIYLKATTYFTNLFPLWTIIFATWAVKQPAAFAWFSTEYYTGALGLLMLSMGITLTVEDFKRILQRPNAIIVGFLFCYAMMPALAFGLSSAFSLSPELTAGLVLVGAINGGQASNLCAYIANGDVALSVLMTTVTTLGAIIFTPLLCKLLLGAVVPVNAAGIAMSTIQVVLVPIVLGMTLNKFFHKAVEKVVPLTPVIGTLCTCILVAASVAQCAPSIVSAGMGLQLPIMLFHLIGGVVGYSLPRVMGFSEMASRTMAIETAMKSSAFGFLLASLHFADFAVRVPSAVSVVWMSVIGSLLAVVWRYVPIEKPKIDRSLPRRFPALKLPWMK